MPDAPDKDLSKDGLLAIAPRDPDGRPTLGGIPLYRKLGQGGMGAVYLGRHPRLGVEVAVKILPFHLADQDPNAIEFFMREANVAARLNHPSLVRIFDVNVDGDPKAGSAIWYLVMEFVSGLTAGRLMRDRMKAGQGPLPEADALDILLTVSDGLAAAHEQRFVHRDIKPENIIIPRTADGALMFRKAKLMDLGLAKAHSEDLSMGPTGTNVAMGTPGYMSPEQAENAKGAGPPADVFAMGATLYNLLSGAAPFTGTTVLNVLKKTGDEPHVPIRKVNPAVSRPTEVLVDTCLAKRPEARYAAAGVLREALKACRQSLGGEGSAEMTLASLQSLVSIASSDATVREEAPSVLPSAAARTSATAKPPETATAPPSGAALSSAKPRPRSKAPLPVALVLLVAAGTGGFLLLGRDRGAPGTGVKGTPPPDGGSAEFARFMREASEALGEENYERAESLFAKARGLNASSAEATEGETRARRLREEASSVSSAEGELKSLVGLKEYATAWQKIQSAIQRHPEALVLRMLSARLALDHGPYPWLGIALNDAIVAASKAGPPRKSDAIQLRDRLEAKKKEAERAGGVLPQIQLAIDKGEWDEAEKLLAQVATADRESFSRAIDQGRQWQAAKDRGRKAEDDRRWTEALAAYREALTFRIDTATEEAARRVDHQVRKLYDAECDGTLEAAQAGRFEEARSRLAAAEKLQPEGARHGKLKDEIQVLEHLADARRLRGEGKAADALAAAKKALTLRGDSVEAKALVESLQREGPLTLAKAALAAGDRAAGARHAREAALHNPGEPELKSLEDQLWADLFAEKAAATARGPVDELAAASDGRIVGTGAGFGSYAVWSPDDLKFEVSPSPGGSKPFHAALVEKDGLRVAGLSAPPGPDGPEAQPVVVWDQGQRRELVIETSGLKLAVKATRLAPFDGHLVLRILWTAGDENSPDVYSLDILDTEKTGAMNSTSNRAQAHAGIAVAPSGRHFATGGGIFRTWRREGNKTVVDERKGDPQVYLWSRDTLGKRPVNVGEPVGDGALLVFTPDGERLLVATAAKKLFVIDVAGGRVERTIPLPETPTSLGASASRAAVVAGRRVHLVRLDDARVAPATGVAPARSVLFSRDGASLYVGGEDGLLRRYAFEPLAK